MKKLVYALIVVCTVIGVLVVFVTWKKQILVTSPNPTTASGAVLGAMCNQGQVVTPYFQSNGLRCQLYKEGSRDEGKIGVWVPLNNLDVGKEFWPDAELDVLGQWNWKKLSVPHPLGVSLMYPPNATIDIPTDQTYVTINWGGLDAVTGMSIGRFSHNPMSISQQIDDIKKDDLAFGRLTVILNRPGDNKNQAFRIATYSITSPDIIHYTIYIPQREGYIEIHYSVLENDSRTFIPDTILSTLKINN